MSVAIERRGVDLAVAAPLLPQAVMALVMAPGMSNLLRARGAADDGRLPAHLTATITSTVRKP